MTSPLTALFAFGFGNLAMLGWLAAAAVPLAIHLWRRRHPQQEPWAAMDFLLAAIRKTAQRARLNQLLLLAVRTACMAALVLAVAEPFWNRSPGLLGSPTPTHRVLVVDASYSMAYRVGGQSSLDRAKQVAAEIVQSAGPRDAFTLLILGGPDRAAANTASHSVAAVLEDIKQIQAFSTRAELAPALERIESALDRGRFDFSELDRAIVYFLSDLGANSWRHLSEAAWQRWSDRAETKIIDVGSGAIDNAAVVALRLVHPYASTAHKVQFEAEVFNFARRPIEQSLDWIVDGRRVGQSPLKVPAGARARAVFPWQFTQRGDHVVEVALRDDLLPLDDRRGLVVPVVDRIRVLLVNGDGRPAAARYLQRALNPGQGLDELPIDVTTISEGALVESNVDEFDALVLSNVAQFTPAEAALISRYVESGGGLIVFLGDRVQPSRYNEFSLLPAKIGEPVPRQPYHFDPLDYQHPIVAPFAGNQRAGLLTTPVSKYFRLSPRARRSPPAKVALAFRETGDPAIVAGAHGQGAVVLAALPASIASTRSDQSWTLMPAWHSFLPLVQESLAFVLRGRQSHHNTTVGTPLAGRLDQPDPPRMQVPGTAASQPLEAVRMLRDQRWQFDDTWHSGIYRLHAAGQPPQPFAVNVEPGTLDDGESNLRKLGAGELPAPLRAAYVSAANWQATPPDGPGNRGRLPSALFAAALALMLADTSLAWWMGRQTNNELPENR